jgi:hypothetical protein
MPNGSLSSRHSGHLQDQEPGEGMATVRIPRPSRLGRRAVTRDPAVAALVVLREEDPGGSLVARYIPISAMVPRASPCLPLLGMGRPVNVRKDALRGAIAAKA